MIKGSTKENGPTIAVFDIGGVLIDWNPRYLYRTLFDDETAMEHFLATVCTPSWNEAQDAGRPFATAVAELSARFPDMAEHIAAYDRRWMEMVPDSIPGTPEILAELKARGVPLYAITNFSSEKLPLIRERFDFFGHFDGIVVSGELGIVKPDPAIYRALLDGFGLEAGDTVFIDDVQRNVDGARAAGMNAVLFQGAEHLRKDLTTLGLL